MVATERELEKHRRELTDVRRRLEATNRQLTRNLDFTSAILDNLGEGLITCDKDGQIIRANTEACRIWGYEPAAFLKLNLTELMPEPMRARHAQGMKRYMVSRQARVLNRWLILPALHADGSEFSLEINISETLYADDRHIFTAVVRDISERVAGERLLKDDNARLESMVAKRTARLEESKRELERSNAELERFAYIASHDLQAPLRSISSFIRLIEKRNGDHLDDESREYFGFVIGAAKNMKQLIDSLLDYSRVGSRPLERKPVDLNEVCLEARRLLHGLIEQRCAKIHFDPLPTLEGDYRQLVRLFQNLLQNALKFSVDAPIIEISCICPDEIVSGTTISVSDRGIGIPDEQITKIFHLFQRVHSDEYPAGNGMGLAICKRIVERHDGSITVESAVGQGTTFHLHFPDERTRCSLGKPWDQT